ncbi:MAG: hypothetical protein J6386_02880 [Candidatus Synoicihabitans palmerolidicus]|nr:hypothetical protein [Candidatus Synoicihabitans palmerolidicus]
MVGKQVELAFALREKITVHPLLSTWFSFLSMENLIPAECRPSGLEVYYSAERRWSGMLDAWEQDEFVFDPSRTHPLHWQDRRRRRFLQKGSPHGAPRYPSKQDHP